MNKLQCPLVEVNKTATEGLSEEMQAALLRAVETYRSVLKISLEEALLSLANNPDYAVEARRYFAKLAAQSKY